MIRLLADENVPRTSVRRLLASGWDVTGVVRGASDLAAIEHAATEGRVIVTFDRDFGRLALRSDLPRPAGVVLLRLVPSHPEETAELLISLLRRENLVVRLDRVRQRPLGRV